MSALPWEEEIFFAVSDNTAMKDKKADNLHGAPVNSNKFSKTLLLVEPSQI